MPERSLSRAAGAVKMAPMPPLPPDGSRPRNRIREWRQTKGLSQRELAGRTHLGQQLISRLESGRRRLKHDQMIVLARGLDIAPEALLPDSRGDLVPVRFRVASQFSAAAAAVALPAHVLVQARLPDLDECFAAVVCDDSADLIYPPGSMLIARPPSPARGQLQVGRRVLVRSFATDRAGGNAREVLAGYLNHAFGGEISVSTRSSNREVPSLVLVRRGARANDALAERTFERDAPAACFDYVVRDDDPAEILGIIIHAMMDQ